MHLWIENIVKNTTTKKIEMKTKKKKLIMKERKKLKKSK